MLKRYLQNQVKNDLKKKMVFIGGARQVGKTTLALEVADREGYLNWDVPEHKESILRNEFPVCPVLIFDEIHKYRSWRNILKGLFDGRGPEQKILVTGSARLDFYRHGGDSLQGRYHYLRLHPLSFAEINGQGLDDFNALLNYGGFPEPFFQASETETKRWSREYRQRLIQEDLISLEQVREINKLELMMLRLPELCGSPLSLNSIRNDLQVSHKSIAHWLNILEQLYAIIRLSPFGTPQIRAVKKEQKHYHYDWNLVLDQSIRFENMVAIHLLKWVHFLQDTQGRETELRYFRDIDGREVDFVVLEDGLPIKFIECKWNDAGISKGLKYLKARFLNTESWQISAIGKKDYLSKEQIRVCPATIFLKTLI
ncbi:MAG: ATP-binding protein [Calditrichaeota bacterium]|nr:MAG: ATP-binding protein [Calditrichota bacterium]MBL1207758.1 ATP-binding protein [Calditrichota bacterium]NOG47592.1 ATP-binding protein [Calditrichota bacterium]